MKTVKENIDKEWPKKIKIESTCLSQAEAQNRDIETSSVVASDGTSYSQFSSLTAGWSPTVQLTPSPSLTSKNHEDDPRAKDGTWFYGGLEVFQISPVNQGKHVKGLYNVFSTTKRIEHE